MFRIYVLCSPLDEDIYEIFFLFFVILSEMHSVVATIYIEIVAVLNIV